MTITEYDPTKELSTVKGRCEKCDHRWNISEHAVHHLPMELTEKCPKCEHVNIMLFPDDEMNKKMLHQKYVLKLPEQLESAKKIIEKLKVNNQDLQNQIAKLTTENGDQAHAIKILTAFLERVGVKLDEGSNKLAG